MIFTKYTDVLINLLLCFRVLKRCYEIAVAILYNVVESMLIDND